MYQVTHHKIPVYPAFTDFRLAAGLQKGDTVHRQYRNTLRAFTMAGDGGYQRQAITDTDESLVINQEKEASFYIKKLDEIQNHLTVRAKHAYDASVALFNRVDGDVLGEYDQFSLTLDDGDLGGTDGNGITVTKTNVRSLFSHAQRLLKRNNIMLDSASRFTGFRAEDAMANGRGVAVVSPDVKQLLLDSLEGKDTSLGDTVGINGHVGRYFSFDLFESNAVGWSGVLTLGTQPIDGDTVVINGVTLTFKTTLGTTAGNILIGASAATAVDALVAVINDSESLSLENGGAGPSTAGTLYVELSQANRNLFANMTGTDNTSNLGLKAEGYGFITVSETLTASADVWTAAKRVQHCLFGVANAISVVIQKTPNLEVKDRDGKVGSDIVTWMAYGLKTFNDSKVRMVDVQVRTDLYI